MQLLIRQMMSSIGYKYAVHEIVWNPDIDAQSGKPTLSADMRFVPVCGLTRDAQRHAHTSAYELAARWHRSDTGG